MVATEVQGKKNKRIHWKQQVQTALSRNRAIERREIGRHLEVMRSEEH